MKSVAHLFLALFFLGCASQTTSVTTELLKEKSQEKEPTPEEIYFSYPVTVSLSENRKFLEQLENRLITKSEYDSILTELGRTSETFVEIDRLLCSTENDSIYRELVRAEYFLYNDSLVSIAERHLEDLKLADSSNAVLYVFLAASRINQDDYDSGINYLQQSKKYTTPFDNSWLYLLLGSIYQDNDKPYLAIKEYEELFEINSTLIFENWEELYYLFLQTAQFENAEILFSELEQLSKDPDFRKTHWEKLLDLYWKKGDYYNAESICLNVQDSTNYFTTTKELFSISLKKVDYNNAERYLWDLSSFGIKSFPFSSKFSFADFYSWDDHYSESFNQLKSQISQLPLNYSANFSYGYLIIAKELNKLNEEERDEDKIREGLAYLKKAIPENPDVNFVAGYVYEILKEKTESIAYYEKITDASQYYPYGLINLAVLTKDEDINRSLEYLLQAQDILKTETILIEQIGDYYYIYLNDYQNAIDWYQRLLFINPNESLISIWLSKSFLNLDSTDRALSVINETIDRIYIGDDSWTRNWHLGMAYKTKGDINQKLEKWHQAKLEYQKSIKHNPDDMEPRFALASVFYQLEDTISAEKTYITVIDSTTSKENIDYSNYHKALSSLNMHYFIFDPDPYKRSKLFENAIIHLPKDDWCNRMLGIAYKNQNDYYKATKYLNKAIEINPDSRYNYSTLAETYEQEGTIDKAIKNYERAIRVVEKENLKIDKENEFDDYQSNMKSIGEYYSKIANLYNEKEDYNLAIFEYQKAISITPDTTGILYRFDLASAYFNNKNFERAIENWEIVYKIEKDLNSLFNIGLSYLNLGDHENLKKSKTIFTDLIENIQDNADLIEIKSKAHNFIEGIDSELARIEWPVKIEELASSDQGVVSEIAKLYQLTDQYREINNLWLEGVKETTPNKEYLSYSKKWIITSYNVSPKIFQSESLCDRFKAKLSSLTISNSRLKEVQSLWISAAETRKEGIQLNSEGYYVKKKDYSGEYERGEAKIDVSDQYYVDGLKILIEEMRRHPDNISDFGITLIQYLIDYYLGD